MVTPNKSSRSCFNPTTSSRLRSRSNSNEEVQVATIAGLAPRHRAVHANTARAMPLRQVDYGRTLVMPQFLEGDHTEPVYPRFQTFHQKTLNKTQTNGPLQYAVFAAPPPAIRAAMRLANGRSCSHLYERVGAAAPRKHPPADQRSFRRPNAGFGQIGKPRGGGGA